MSTHKNPFEGKTNQECIDLVAHTINKCRDDAKRSQDNFQTELDVLIDESTAAIDSSPHYEAMIKSFIKVAEEMQERERSAVEMVKIHRDHLILMKSTAQKNYEANLKIALLNQELNRRLKFVPAEYDPASVPSCSKSVPVSNQTTNVDLSLSQNTEDELLKSNNSEYSAASLALSQHSDALSSSVPHQPETQSNEKLSESAEIRELQKIPLPDEKMDQPVIPVAPPLPEEDVSPRTQERFNLKPFSVVLNEKVEEMKSNRRSKRTATSKIVSTEAKADTVDESKENFLEKLKIVPRLNPANKEDRLSSNHPQNKEGVVKESNNAEAETNADILDKIEDVVPTSSLNVEDILSKINKSDNKETMENIPTDSKFEVATSTTSLQQSAGSTSQPDRVKRSLESTQSSTEKSPFREPLKRPHRSNSPNVTNLVDEKKEEKPRSILRKRSPIDSSNKNRSPSREKPPKKAPQSNIQFDPLIITKKIGSNNEPRCVVTGSLGTKQHESRAGPSNEPNPSNTTSNLFDGGRIPKKKRDPSPPRLPTPPPRPPRLPLRSDPGWAIVSTPPQRRCFILRTHELPAAELSQSRNHVYTRLVEEDPDTLVHVTLRKKNGRVENFIAESTLGWPGVPHLPYDLTRQIIPEVISSGFALGRGLIREQDRTRPGYKKWERMVFDPYLKYSFCCVTMLDLEETKVISVDEEKFKIPWMRNGHLPVFTHQIAEITLQSDTVHERADFTFQIHLVDMKKSNHFNINRIILGQDFLERYLVCADASYERGRLYFENRSKPPRFYKTTAHPKDEERYPKTNKTAK